MSVVWLSDRKTAMNVSDFFRPFLQRNVAMVEHAVWPVLDVMYLISRGTIFPSPSKFPDLT